MLVASLALCVMDISPALCQDAMLQPQDSNPEGPPPRGLGIEWAGLLDHHRSAYAGAIAENAAIHPGSARVRAMANSVPTGSETAAEVRGFYTLPFSCGGVTFSKDEANFLVRSGNVDATSQCGDLVFRGNGIAGLGSGVFANMTLTSL